MQLPWKREMERRACQRQRRQRQQRHRRQASPIWPWSMPTLLRHLGPKDCFELLATGRVVLAEEALRLRLVNLVVPAGELVERACAVAESAALYGAASMKRIKAAIDALGQGVVPSAP